ncbi:hypothetical protein N7539_003746 [Penicillium diatomitis]|uniref:Uncharacterized protein n=1 Tax=Penicillium diatomitis TaxID=2819901 RepID=A0A9W9XCN4_9EURO|nr:uncharacterized protein N7539_003746 [Penicillium diatomitis]KAJ5488856.1 hypothetical protein N7539_003746 [Penicillium diatomitis]
METRDNTEKEEFREDHKSIIGPIHGEVSGANFVATESILVLAIKVLAPRKTLSPAFVKQIMFQNKA